jgi:hypothetical protein
VGFVGSEVKTACFFETSATSQHNVTSRKTKSSIPPQDEHGSSDFNTTSVARIRSAVFKNTDAKKSFRRPVPQSSSGTQVERHRYTLWTEWSLCMLQHTTCAVATTLNRIHLGITTNTAVSFTYGTEPRAYEYSYKATLLNVY